MTTSALLAGVVMACAVPATAQVASKQGQIEGQAPANRLSVSAGADYSSGSYGESSKTKILIAPLSIADKVGMWRLTATLPYLHINGPGNVVIGPDGRPLPGVPSAQGTRSGVGDLTLGASATLPSADLGGFSLELTGRVKLPTSQKSKHLGTGKTDYSVEADLSRPIGDWAPFVTVGYRMPGSPAGVDLKNTFSGSVGTSLVMGKMVAIAAYDYSEASSPLAKNSQDLFAALSAPITDQLNWTVYGIGGLSKGSPDYEGGVLLTYKLD